MSGSTLSHPAPTLQVLSPLKGGLEQNRINLAIARLAVLTVLVLAMVVTPSVKAQTFIVIHTFADGEDGADPASGVTIDSSGNLYGTTPYGGSSSGHYGVVYRLQNKHNSWVLSPLYAFAGGTDGANPGSRVTIGSNGTLYGSTYYGGLFQNGCSGGDGCGTIFNLKPTPTRPATPLTPWIRTLLYDFQGGSDGWQPAGDLVFDQAGNIYGTTFYGAYNGFGSVYKLTPSGDGWTESLLFQDPSGSDWIQPSGGVILDSSGDLFGVFAFGGTNSWGGVYELTPSGSGWIETTLHNFTYASDGGEPIGGLIMDSSGNLYGTTSLGGPEGGGTVFELTPSGGSWTFSVLYSFTGGMGKNGPIDKLNMDAAGNLYGTTYSEGAYGYGAVFKLIASGGSWTYSSLHDFANGNDGAYPACQPVFDAKGNLYGTASAGGSLGVGVVWEIMP
jgi:uncharacterized repeat protein (TIGR03803 family)